MLRIAKKEDLPRMLAIYSHYVETTTASFEYEPPSLEEFTRRFEEFTAQFPWLVWQEGEQVLGYAYASAPFTRAAYRWCAEPSVYLAPEARGRRIGEKLYQGLEWFLEKQGYRVLYSLVTQENQASLAFHRRLGWQPVAELPACGYKFHRWLGLVWLEKRLPFVEEPSSFPVSWLEIVESTENLSDILANLSLF